MRKPQLPAVAILFILGGCTGPRVRVAPPSSALRAEILSVSLDVTSRGGPADVETPIKGKGRGALVGAGLGALCCLTTVGIPADSGVLLDAILIPPFAAGGAIYGAVAAQPEEKVNAAQASLKAATKDTDVAMLVRDRLLSRTDATTKLMIAPGGVPPGPTFDHWLEIEIEGPSFTSDGKFNPDVTLFVGARARLRRINHNASLYEGRWLYRGFARPYFQLAGDDAALLRADLQAAAEGLADKILLDLFVATESELARTPKPGQAVTLPSTDSGPGPPWAVNDKRPIDLLKAALLPTHCP